MPGKNPFGAVASGWLIIRSPLLSLQVDVGLDITKKEELTTSPYYDNDLLFCPELEDVDVTIVSSFDYPREPVRQLWALPLASVTGLHDRLATPTDQSDDSNVTVGSLSADNGPEKPWFQVSGIMLSAKENDPAMHKRVGYFEVKGVELSDFMNIPKRLDSKAMTII